MVFCCNNNIFSPDINNFPYHFPPKFSIEIGIIQLPTFGNIPHGPTDPTQESVFVSGAAVAGL